jgi:hypothetical protein
MLGMVAAQSYKLFAYRAAAIRLATTVSRMCHDALHFLAARQTAVRAAALVCVHQRLDATLDGQTARFGWTLGRHVALTVGWTCTAGTIVQVETDALHLMRMLFFLVALYAEVVVLQ